MNGLLLSLLLVSIISVVSIVAFSSYIFPKNKPENSSENTETTIIVSNIPQINSTENEIEETTTEKTPSDEKGNDKIIWDFLKDNDLTDAGAAGLMGNLYAESKLESVIYEDKYKKSIGLTDQEYVDKVNDGTYTNFVKDKVGFGLAQWTFSTRKEALLNKCKGQIGDLYCQLEYLLEELKKDFKTILNLLKTSNDTYESTIQVLVNFENPADKSDTVKNKRYSYSLKYYNKFALGDEQKETKETNEPKEKTYTVVAGDTLSAIAKKFGTTVEILCQLNGINDPNKINVGLVLILP